jgi:hypothetical protein
MDEFTRCKIERMKTGLFHVFVFFLRCMALKELVSHYSDMDWLMMKCREWEKTGPN